MPFLLYTRKDVRLVAPNGRDAISLDEPALAIFLVLLAVAGPSGAAIDDLLLYLTPDLTAEKGKLELERLASLLRDKLGGEATVVRTATAYALPRGLLDLDVHVGDAEAPRPCADFLANVDNRHAPERADWIRRTRLRVVPRDLAPARSASRPRRRRYAAIALAAAAITAAGAYVATPRAVQGFSAGDPLLVSDIQNETGDTLLDLGVATAATVALQQSSHLRLYSRGRLPTIYRLMRIPNPDTTLTFALARQVAQRDHVRFVLGLEIARAGDRYRVTGRLADVASDATVYTTTADAASRADILSALDDVLATTRRRLGESRRSVADHRIPLPFVTTPSLEALRSYAEGSVAWSKGQYSEARELWMRAVDLDTGFAMAYGALGTWSYYNHNRPDGERYMREAFSRSNRLTEWERLRLLGNEAAFSGMRDSAIVITRLVADRFPNAITWYDYGTSLMRVGRSAEAEAALLRSLAFDSTRASTYVNLATASRSRGDFDRALDYYAKAARIDSLILYSGNVNLEWGSSYVYLGRLAEAESAFARMSRAPGLYDRNLGYRALGSLAMWQGHADQAIGLFRKAADASVQDRSELSELRNRLFLSSAYRSVGRLDEANDELTKALILARDPRIEPRVLAMIATSCMKLGRTADAEALLRMLDARVGARDPGDSAAGAYVAGLASLARRRVDSALVYLPRAARLPDDVSLNVLAAEVYRAAGNLDSARAAASRILETRAFGLEAQEDFLRAPLVLGDLAIAANDTAAAIKHYQQVVDRRRGAQLEVTDVAAARTRLAALRTSGGR
jgi:tetratricopeptide (TPR) repeat protein